MFELSRKLLCLDWDKRSLRIVVARVGGGRMTLEDAHSHRLPDSVDPDDPQTMGPYIAQMLRRHHLRHKGAVVVDVPRERAVINRLTLPPTPPAEVAAAVRFQAMKELPFPLDTAAVDYVITDRDDNGNATQLLLAAVTTETLDRVRATCEAAGLTPSRIGLRPFANLVSVRQLTNLAGSRVLFVDVGPAATEIDVFRGEALSFARSANVNVPLPMVEPGQPEDDRPISITEISAEPASDEALGLAVDELLVEVTRTLQAYRATEPDAAIDQIVVAGSTGVEAQLGDLLHRRLHLSVALFDPTDPLRIDPIDGPKLRSFPAALGLAWGLGREGLLAIDFLNPKRPVSPHETLKRRLRLAGAGVGVVLAVAVALLVKEYVQQRQILSALKSGNSQTWKTVLKQTELKNRADEIREWKADAIWPDELLNVTECAIDPGKKMVVQEITLDSASRNPSISLKNVFVADWQVAQDFVRKLNEMEQGGKLLYQARTGPDQPVIGGKLFRRKLDIPIGLRRLYEEREKAPAREKARKDRLRPP